MRRGRAIDINRAVRILKNWAPRWNLPVVGVIAERTHDPFKVLISCVLSLRTRDETTAGASARLFALADTPQALSQMQTSKIERAIYPVGFYRRKAGQIKEISRLLLERYGGKVPDRIDELLTLPGVGRKTANLVVTVSYRKPGICVDTHVHRISNRIGFVKTKTPERTEQALREKLPRRHWIIYNDLLVPFGQNICTPLSPKCSICQLAALCPRIGVGRSR